MTTRRLRAVLVLGVSLCFFAAVPLAGHASPPSYTQYVILNGSNGYTETVEPGATISQLGSPAGTPTVGEGPVSGFGLVFACGTPDTADFSLTTPVLGGPLDTPVPPCSTRPQGLIGLDDQFTIKVTASGNTYGIDFLSWATDRLGCIDADAGASCAAAGGRTSYNREPSEAMSGDLDPNFGTGGKVMTAIGAGGDTAYDLAFQSDGKILAAGSCGSDFCLARYNGDGSLDTSFDTDGLVTTAVASSFSWSQAVAVQSDGKIVAALGCPNTFCLARYNSNGSLDTSFDADGLVTTDVGTGRDITTEVLIQSDQRIVATGYCRVDDDTKEFCLARYNSDGSLDTSFDGDGKVANNLGFNDADIGVGALQSDGKIVVVGKCGPFELGDSCIARFNINGSLDTSFDGDGLATTVIANGSYLASVAVQGDGKIVATGSFLARYNSDGSLDTSFDGEGMVTYPIASFGRGLALQSDGGIVVAVFCPSGVFGEVDFCLARFNGNGRLDTSFDTDGFVTTSIGVSDFLAAVAVQSDGKIVAAGGCNSAAFGPNDFCLARYGAGGITNQVPVGANDSYSVVQGNPLSVVAADGVLANDSDPDAGTILTAVLVAGPANGTLTLNPNGSFSYTPNATFFGTDTFTYRASDGSLTSSVVTATIVVSSTASQISGLSGVTSGQKSSLQDKLAKAQAFFDSGKLGSACGKLDEFIAQVNGLTPAKISPSVSAVLINSANALRTLYGCPA